MEKAVPDPDFYDEEEHDALLISRYPLDATKQWTQGNEKEVLDWNFNKTKRRIYLSRNLKLGKF
jgi:hypothetical protein